MENVLIAIKHRKQSNSFYPQPENISPFAMPTSFIIWEHLKFPTDFFEKYLSELMDAGIIDEVEKNQIENELWTVNWRRKRVQNIDNLATHFPALFMVSEDKDFPDLNPLNQKIQLQLANHSPRILPLCNFLREVYSIRNSEECMIVKMDNHSALEKNLSGDISEIYCLLDCYTHIFSFSSSCKNKVIKLTPRLLPTLLEKSLEIGQIDLLNWCIDTLKKTNPHCNVSTYEQFSVLETALDCLYASNFKDASFLKKWNPQVQILISAGAKPPSKSKIKTIFHLLAVIEWQIYNNLLKEGKSSDEMILFHQNFASLLASVLLMNPLISTGLFHDIFFGVMVGLMLSKSPYYMNKTPYVLHGNGNFFGNNYKSSKAGNEFWKNVLSPIPSGFIEDILENFISRYTLLKRADNPLDEQKILSQLLDWLAIQSRSRLYPIRSIIAQLLDIAFEQYYFEKKEEPSSQENQAQWDDLTSQLLMTGLTPDFQRLINKIIILVPQLLRARIGLFYVDAQSMTILQKAVTNRWIGLTCALLQEEVNPNLPTLRGNSALHLALSDQGQPVNAEIVKLLIKNPKTDLKQQDKHGWTPLHRIVSLNDVDLLDYLLNESFANNRSIGYDIKTNWNAPARTNDQKNIVTRWSSFVIKKNAWSTHKKTALEMAEMRNLVEFEKKLSQHIEQKEEISWAEKSYSEEIQDKSIIIETDKEKIIIRPRERIHSNSPSMQPDNDDNLSNIIIEDSSFNFNRIETTSPIKLQNEISFEHVMYLDKDELFYATENQYLNHVEPFPAAFETEDEKDILRAEMINLKNRLSKLSKNQALQDVEHAVVTARLNRIESILEESLCIVERYKNEVAPFPLRRTYYQRVRAEIATNFSAVLLLTSKLIQPWQGKLDDACGSRSKKDALLNITVLSAEALEPMVEGMAFMTEQVETVFKLIHVGLEAGLKTAEKTTSSIPAIGGAVGAGVSLIGGATWLAEFYRELEKIDHAHHSLMDLTPKDVEHLAEKIALRMTDRVKDVLEFLTDEGLKQLAFFDHRRMLMGLLQGEFKKSILLDDIIGKLCDYQVKQGRFCFRVPLTGEVHIKKDKVVSWLKTHYSVTVNSSDIPNTLNENWLHNGAEVLIKAICKKKRIDISARTGYRENPSLENLNNEKPQKINKSISDVKGTAIIHNKISALAIENKMIRLELGTCNSKITQLIQEKKESEKKIKQLVYANQLLEQRVNEVNNKQFEDNSSYYSNGIESYKEGKRQRQLSKNEKLNENHRVIYSVSASQFFFQAKHNLKKVDSLLLQENEPEKFRKLNKTLQKCDNYRIVESDYSNNFSVEKSLTEFNM